MRSDQCSHAAEAANRLPDSLAAGIDYLGRTQHAAGSWTDFWVPVGSSDAWVTAYAGLALQAAADCPILADADRAAAGDAARKAANWLLRCPRPRQGWGYNAAASPDADSTAHALSLIARVGFVPPADAIAFLREHQTPDGTFQTYRRRDPHDQWAWPWPDITAAALRALLDLGELTPATLPTIWPTALGRLQEDSGWWNGYWWLTPAYATGLALEVWQAAGCPPLAYPIPDEEPGRSAFDLAWAVQIQAIGGERVHAALLASRLIQAQDIDGGWRSTAILRVPPSRNAGHAKYRGLRVHDARRVFVTATAVRALALTAAVIGPPVEERRAGQHSSQKTRAPRSRVGRVLDDLVADAALALGFDRGSAETAKQWFATLTAESLLEPAPWPAAQISSLAGGLPLEFSATVGRVVKPALRYAVEVGDPLLPPYRRATSGTAAISRTAGLLGYDAAWQRVSPAVETLVASDLPVPDGLRFWVWGGIDQVVPERAGAHAAPALKIYVNLLHHEIGPARERLERALAAAEIPVSSVLRFFLDALDDAGFLHEIGFGMGPGGKIACKVYYELRGWRRGLVRQLLGHADLPVDCDALCPEIHGILRESLAAKSRAGIAVRLDPATGAVRDVTTAAAFPTPLLRPSVTCRRVAAWIEANGWDGSAYDTLSHLLLPGWEGRDQGFGRMNSLFTRTITEAGSWSTIYLRPSLPEGTATD